MIWARGYGYLYHRRADERETAGRALEPDVPGLNIDRQNLASRQVMPYTGPLPGTFGPVIGIVQTTTTYRG